MRNWLENQYVILTGASDGIGKRLCKILIGKYHAKVIGVGRSEEKMLALKRELGESAEAFSYRLFDVGQKENWLALKDELLANDLHPTLLINNAGVFPPIRKVTDTPSERTERIIRTNFYSVVYAVETLSPILCDSGKYKPSVVNICSSAALCSLAGMGAYSASKGALKSYSEALQLEEKGKMHVGIIYPGTTATELFREEENTKNSALDLVAMPAEKMAKKIERAIFKRRKRAVLGWDAKLMNFLAKIAPVKGPALLRFVLKTSKSKVFSEVFDYEKDVKPKNKTQE